MKKLVGMLLVLFMFVGVTLNAQVSKETEKLRNGLINDIGKSGNETIGFKLEFSDNDKTMIASAYLKLKELNELPPSAAELFWSVMYDQWTPDVRLGMVMKLKVIYFELILYDTNGNEIGRFKDKLMSYEDKN